MKGRRILLILAIAALLVGCGGVQTPSRPVIQGADQASGALTTKNMDAVHGQKTTCGGPAEKIFNIDVIEQMWIWGWGPVSRRGPITAVFRLQRWKRVRATKSRSM